jgi:hypothetical protein
VSDFRAIATVTKVLATMIQNSVNLDVPGAQVRTARPEAPPNGTPPAEIDLFLYQVTPNAAFRADDLPTRRSDGTLVQRPRAALDLHYLLSFRGNELDLEPQRLLGSAVRTLHGTAILGRPLVHAVETDAANPFLAGSDLADAPELVKVTPLPLSLEELSKLWSVFFQVPYNLSVAYQATVVAIEGDETPRPALPVLERLVYVVPLQTAVVDQVEASSGGPIVSGATLVLKGRNLRRPVTRVSLSGVEVGPQLATDTEIQVPLTVPPFPANGLRAGVQGVMVVHPVLMGDPLVEHAGFHSNAVPLVFRPSILAHVLNPGQLDVTLDPPLRAGQRATLLLNLVAGAAAHQFTNAIAAVDQSTVSFALTGVAPGQYLMRVRVDGAESPLVLDASDPLFGPTVTIP